MHTSEDTDVIPVGVFDCKDPFALASDLTSEGYTMRMKYATVTHDFRDTRYFYFIPQLIMPETDGLSNFKVQLYTQLVTSDTSSLSPTLRPCTRPTYETVALTVLVDTRIDLCQQTWFLQQYRGTTEMYSPDATGSWEDYNSGELI